YSPVEVSGAVPGRGDGSVLQKGVWQVPFDPRQHLQRPGLLLSNKVLYIAFGSHGDFNVGDQKKRVLDLFNLPDYFPGYHGWVFAYSADPNDRLKPLALFNTNPDVPTDLIDNINPFGFRPAGAGIWMSGSGPAADSQGDIYLVTGNGKFDAS